MSDISIRGIFGALCVAATIAVGVLGLLVAVIYAAGSSWSGSRGFLAALKRAVAGPAACTGIGLLSLAWVAEATDNEVIDNVGPFLLLAGLAGGVAAGVVVSRRLRRSARG
jgi:hypothetical protein